MATVFIRGMSTRGEDLERLAAELRELAPALPRRLEASPDDVEAGLARLVLTLVEFLRQVLEHQAVRRMQTSSSMGPQTRADPSIVRRAPCRAQRHRSRPWPARRGSAPATCSAVCR